VTALKRWCSSVWGLRRSSGDGIIAETKLAGQTPAISPQAQTDGLVKQWALLHLTSVSRAGAFGALPAGMKRKFFVSRWAGGTPPAHLAVSSGRREPWSVMRKSARQLTSG
jgi:hypothetical protein